MKIAFLFAAAAAATAQAFAPSSSFTPVVSVNNARTSGSALSMAMERTYIMVSCQKNAFERLRGVKSKTHSSLLY
jgi:hypothetical protein